MEVVEEKNGVIKVDCAPFELAVEVNSALVRFVFATGAVDREKYEKEIRESCLKSIALINEFLEDVPDEIRGRLPDLKLITNEEKLLHFLEVQ